jgi:uncharacterized protein YbjT (DUF2867 family)
MTMPTYAVTGASGQLGRLAVQELLARGVPASDVIAVVRTRGEAADLAERGVQVREADYARPQTLGGALVGVDRLLLISSSEAGQRVAHHTNVIEAAKEYASWLQDAGLDEASASFVAALDASIAHGDLETHSEDLMRLLGRPATPLTDVLGAARGGEVRASGS